MKKLSSVILAFCCSVTLFAQAPTNYYNNATGSGLVLKSQLKSIITNKHTPLTYGDLWDLYSKNASNNAFRDKYYEKDNTILDIYTEKPGATETYTFTVITDQCGSNGYKNEGDCYNREHLIPQSYFDEQFPMKADAFHVWPTDGKVNNERDNYAFGTVAAINITNNNFTSTNGTKRGDIGVSGFTSTIQKPILVVEPIDEFKGDIARAFFYFATRYEDSMDDFYKDNPHVGVSIMFDGSTGKVFNDNFLDVLYQWHRQDPVSSREIDMNNLVYNEQGNRNPYIDNPSYVTAVWYPHLLDTYNADLVEFNVYPNPAPKNTIYVSTKEKVDEAIVYNITGKVIKKISNPKFYDEVLTINNLKSGTYFIKLKSGKRNTTKKFIVK